MLTEKWKTYSFSSDVHHMQTDFLSTHNHLMAVGKIWDHIYQLMGSSNISIPLVSFQICLYLLWNVVMHFLNFMCALSAKYYTESELS